MEIVAGARIGSAPFNVALDCKHKCIMILGVSAEVRAVIVNPRLHLQSEFQLVAERVTGGEAVFHGMTGDLQATMPMGIAMPSDKGAPIVNDPAT